MTDELVDSFLNGTTSHEAVFGEARAHYGAAFVHEQLDLLAGRITKPTVVVIVYYAAQGEYR